MADALSPVITALQRDLPVIASAWPTLSVLAAVLIGSAWWLRGYLAKSEINGLKAEIGGLKQQISNIGQQLKTRDERSRLAGEKFEQVETEKDRLGADVEKMKTQIAEKQSLFDLECTSGSAETHVHRLTGLLADLKTTLVATAPIVSIMGKKDDEEG